MKKIIENKRHCNISVRALVFNGNVLYYLGIFI